MASLYSLTQEFQQLANMDAGDDDAFREALSETLAATGLQIEDKIEATVIVARQLDADAELCKAEAKRLSERAAAIQRNADACRERVRQAMADRDQTKITRPLFTITRVAGRAVCHVTQQDALPAQYIKAKTVESVDKTALLQALKNGEAIPGAELGTGTESLRIK